LQQLLQEEVEQALGRARYARRDGVDAAPGYRNGFGRPRRLSAMAGTITVRRPRVRGLEARFESRLLPLFKRRTEAVGRLLPELYLHGPRGTSTWPGAGCWGRRRRCRPRRSRG
jgi:transposase-like protein